jgi:hypothetical protein
MNITNDNPDYGLCLERLVCILYPRLEALKLRLLHHVGL